MAVDQIEAMYQREMASPGSLFETFGEQVMRRVEDVLAERDCLYRATLYQLEFLRRIRSHQGERRAVCRAAWENRLSIDDRILRKLVQSLRQDFGVAIGTARDGGYFLIETREEYDEAIRQLTLHAVTTLRVAHGMSSGRATIDDLMQQLRLQLTNEETPR